MAHRSQYIPPRTYPVTVPVVASVGPILGHVAPEEDEHWDRPWAVLASVRVTFRFGRRVRSKILVARHQFTDEPYMHEVFAGWRECVADLTDQLAAHGIAIVDHPGELDLTDRTA